MDKRTMNFNMLIINFISFSKSHSMLNFKAYNVCGIVYSSEGSVALTKFNP